jgi:hypothetical protein
MEQSLLDGIAQSGTLGLLLGASLYWFARVHLPERDRLQRELLERIAKGHEDAVVRLAESLERNTRALARNSEAVLALSFARAARGGGISREEAEALLRRVNGEAADRAGAA